MHKILVTVVVGEYMYIDSDRTIACQKLCPIQMCACVCGCVCVGYLCPKVYIFILDVLYIYKKI